MSADQNKYRRVADDAPDRCQAVTAHGQCRMGQIAGSKYCFVHGGARTLKSQEKEAKSNFLIAAYQRRLSEKTQTEKQVSLREEIALLRMLVEEQFNNIDTPTALIARSATISDLITRIERVVTSCHKLERSLGDLIDKPTLLLIVDNIVLAITEILKDLPDADIRITEIAEAMRAIVEEGKYNEPVANTSAPVELPPLDVDEDDDSE